MAKHAPRSLEALLRLRSIRDGARGRAQEILQTIELGLARDPAEYAAAAPPPDLPAAASATVELFRVLLKAISAEQNIAPRLLASTQDLEQLARFDEPDIPALRGWRRELFGEKALALKSGKLALGLDKNEINLVRL